MKNREINFDRVIARMKATHQLGPISKEEQKATIIDTINVRNKITGIASREGVSDERIRSDMMEAIRASKNSPDPQVQELWTTFHYAGEEPTPEEFILWFRDLFLLSLDEKLKGSAE